MSTQTPLQPTTGRCYTLKGGVSFESISVACESLFLEDLTDPLFIALSPADHDALREKLRRDCDVQSEDEMKRTTAIKQIINQTTGTLMDVFVTERIPQGTALFGQFNLDGASQ